MSKKLISPKQLGQLLGLSDKITIGRFGIFVTQEDWERLNKIVFENKSMAGKKNIIYHRNFSMQIQ
jgi:hypothetical protein